MKNKTNMKIIFAIIFSIIFFAATIAVFASDADIPIMENLRFTNKTTTNTYNLAYYMVNQQPDPAAPGDVVEVRWKLENQGSVSLNNVTVELILEYPFSIYPGYKKVQTFGSISPLQRGENSVMVYYKLLVDRTAAAGDYKIKVRYMPDIPSKGYAWSTQTFTLRVQERESVISIENITTEPSDIAPGGKSVLKLTLNNRMNSFLKNIKVKLDLRTAVTTASTYTISELPFTPIGSTNEEIVEYLPGQGTADVTFTLMADPNAESKVYRVPITISYSDELGRNFTQSNIIGLVIGQKPELFASIDETDIYTSGKTGKIVVKFVNRGANSVKFLNVELTENKNVKTIGKNDIYIGKIDSDDYETAEFKVYLGRVRGNSVNIPLHITYKDDNNFDYEEDLNVKMNLYSSFEAKRYGLVQGNKAVGFFVILIISIVDCITRIK